MDQFDLDLILLLFANLLLLIAVSAAFGAVIWAHVTCTRLERLVGKGEERDTELIEVKQCDVDDT